MYVEKHIIIFFYLYRTTKYIVELGTKYTNYKYRMWLQNPIARSNLMETFDMLVGSVLFPNSQVRTVNVTLFAIGNTSDFIPFAENYRKAMGLMGTSVRAYKVETGEGARFSLR